MIYELRIYTILPGRIDAIRKRFPIIRSVYSPDSACRYVISGRIWRNTQALLHDEIRKHGRTDKTVGSVLTGQGMERCIGRESPI